MLSDGNTVVKVTLKTSLGIKYLIRERKRERIGEREYNAQLI